MGRSSVKLSALVGVFVAAIVSKSVLFRASWLLPSDFDGSAFLIRLGGGPLVGLGLVVLGVITFWGIRSLLRVAMRQTTSASVGSESDSRRTVLANAARSAVRGVGAGLVAGAVIPWVLIALDGMGNGGDTSIVGFEVRDFVVAAAFGFGVFLIASVSLRPQRVASLIDAY